MTFRIYFLQLSSVKDKKSNKRYNYLDKQQGYNNKSRAVYQNLTK
jgi:hypothetical protein